jgi:hypothetical protein
VPAIDPQALNKRLAGIHAKLAEAHGGTPEEVAADVAKADGQGSTVADGIVLVQHLQDEIALVGELAA